MEAEKHGQSEDVCTYVKSDIGMMLRGNIGPNGKKLPDPDVLMLSYTGCFTFLKWFELLRHHYKCKTVMLHVPYEGRDGITKNARDYVVKQLKEDVIPALEEVSGVKFDIDRLREVHEAIGKGRGGLGLGPAQRQEYSLSDRRLFWWYLLYWTNFHGLSRNRRSG